jgi:hypothetical protein
VSNGIEFAVIIGRVAVQERLASPGSAETGIRWPVPHKTTS